MIGICAVKNNLFSNQPYFDPPAYLWVNVISICPQEWDEISADFGKKLISNCSKRLTAVISNKGYSIKYSTLFIDMRPKLLRFTLLYLSINFCVSKQFVISLHTWSILNIYYIQFKFQIRNNKRSYYFLKKSYLSNNFASHCMYIYTYTIPIAGTVVLPLDCRVSDSKHDVNMPLSYLKAEHTCNVILCIGKFHLTKCRCL